MRVPLSWLRDFAPFDRDPAELVAALDDLGLVVEDVETVGEGLADVVVARVTAIAAIEGADRIRQVTVEDGTGPVEVVCGAWNFDVGDLVPLATVGAVLPGGFEIGRRKMKGVVSNGMLCSGRELDLTDDAEGILVLDGTGDHRPGQPLTAALGIEPDVVFDVAVEANRPDALSVAGVARDLAARLGLPFAIPEVATWPGTWFDRPGGWGRSAGGPGRRDAGVVARGRPRVVPPLHGPGGHPRRGGHVPAVARPAPGSGRHATDQQRGGRVQLRDARDRAADPSLRPRPAARARPRHPAGCARRALTTLDGVVRTLGLPGSLGDDGRDCLICDAQDVPVAIGGIMGGSSSEIDAGTTRVLLETAYFDPMSIARTSKRLGPRTEASARFERGCDPAAIDLAGERFCQLLALEPGPAMSVAPGVLDVQGRVPAPFDLDIRPSQIDRLLGATFASEEIVGLLAPLGIRAEPLGTGDDDPLRLTVPTHRPDIRPAPMGEADIAEEVARASGYSRIARRLPSWPQPGRLTGYQRGRRQLKDVLCGLGSTEAWTPTFVTEQDQAESGFDPPYIEVTNPLVESERFLRSSMAPGLVRAVVRNSERRHPNVRLFEVGTVFSYPENPDVGPKGAAPADTSERLSAIFAGEGDDAWRAVAAWRTIAAALRLAEWALGDRALLGPVASVLQPSRSAVLASIVLGPPDGSGATEPRPSSAWSESSPPGWWNSSACSTRRGGPDGSAGSTSTSMCCSTPSGFPGAARRPGRSAGSRHPTSTWRSWCRTPSRPDRWSGRCGRPRATCWSRSSSSTSTEVPRSPKGRAVSPSASGSALSTTRSPIGRSGSSGPGASPPLSSPTARCCAEARRRSPVGIVGGHPLQRFEEMEGALTESGGQQAAVLDGEGVEEGIGHQLGVDVIVVLGVEDRFDQPEGPRQRRSLDLDHPQPGGDELGQLHEHHRRTEIVVTGLDQLEVTRHEFGQLTYDVGEQESEADPDVER